MLYTKMNFADYSEQLLVFIVLDILLVVFGFVV